MEPPRVFISHSWVDKPLARRVARRLSQSGSDVFIDEDRRTALEGTSSLSARLEDAISRTDYVVVIWTESAAASGWVAAELAYVQRATVKLIPLLLFDPKANPTINDTLGVLFTEPHRFERALADLLPRILGDGWDEPDLQTLERDFSLTIQETPTIASALADPLTHRAAEDGIDELREIFEAWLPEGVFTAGLPHPGHPDYHALDFAMWCAARIALSDERRVQVGPGREAPETAAYPPIFARILATTAAGFEALAALLTASPSRASNAVAEFLYPAKVRDVALPAVVEIYDVLLRAMAQTDGTPVSFESARLFLKENRSRLSDEQKLTLFRLVDVGGGGPYNGGPLDLLGEYAVDPGLIDDVLQRVEHWVRTGKFDRNDPDRKAMYPRYFYGFVGERFENGLTDEAAGLLEGAAATRIQRLFRSQRASDVVTALQWVIDAERLPAGTRSPTARAFRDGVYSAEFERWPHPIAVRSLAEDIVGWIQLDQRADVGPVAELKRVLGEAGLQGLLY